MSPVLVFNGQNPFDPTAQHAQWQSSLTHPPPRHKLFFRAAEMPPFLIAHRDPSQVSTDDPRRALVPSAEHPAIPPCEWSIHEPTPRCWRPSPLFRGPETWAPASRIGHIPLSAPNPSALGFLLLNGFTRTAGPSCECHLHHRCFLSASIILHVDPFFASSNLPLSAIAKCIRCDNIFSLGR